MCFSLSPSLIHRFSLNESAGCAFALLFTCSLYWLVRVWYAIVGSHSMCCGSLARGAHNTSPVRLVSGALLTSHCSPRVITHCQCEHHSEKWSLTCTVRSIPCTFLHRIMSFRKLQTPGPSSINGHTSSLASPPPMPPPPPLSEVFFAHLYSSLIFLCALWPTYPHWQCMHGPHLPVENSTDA